TLYGTATDVGECVDVAVQIGRVADQTRTAGRHVSLGHRRNDVPHAVGLQRLAVVEAATELRTGQRADVELEVEDVRELDARFGLAEKGLEDEPVLRL